ncbi:MAG: hypothetical protein BHV93_06895 [Clostridiales bacterium 52_15]|nr:MAG: hypothetical protein BHV93_06895 [Clostridiales bacterium 52_15]
MEIFHRFFLFPVPARLLLTEKSIGDIMIIGYMASLLTCAKILSAGYITLLPIIPTKYDYLFMCLQVHLDK